MACTKSQLFLAQPKQFVINFNVLNLSVLEMARVCLQGFFIIYQRDWREARSNRVGQSHAVCQLNGRVHKCCRYCIYWDSDVHCLIMYDMIWWYDAWFVLEKEQASCQFNLAHLLWHLSLPGLVMTVMVSSYFHTGFHRSG